METAHVYVSTIPTYDAKRFAKLASGLARAIDPSLDERATITETRGANGEVELAGANVEGLEDDELAYFDGRFGSSVGLFGSLQLRLPAAKLARVLERLMREPGASVPY